MDKRGLAIQNGAAGLRNGKEAPVTEPDIEEYFLYT